MDDHDHSPTKATAVLPVGQHAGALELFDSPEMLLSSGQWGMVAFLFSEVAFFCTLIVVYLTFLGDDVVGPTPAEALSLPLVFATTTCLLASSVTIHFAHKKAAQRRSFLVLWGLTIVLGAAFLLGTAYEWRELIEKHELTISRNMFGTTYYTLVGFHGLHVTIGLVALTVVFGLSLARKMSAEHASATELVSWYWHFVDVVWIVVFSVVYLFGR